VRLNMPLEVAEADTERFGGFLPSKQKGLWHQAASSDLV